VCFRFSSIGWLIQYTTPSNVKVNIVSEGLAGRTPVPSSTFVVTTSPDQLSAVWVGRTGPLELRKVFTLDKSGLFITSAVSIRNIDSVVVPNVYCKSTDHLRIRSCCFLSLVSIFLLSCYQFYAPMEQIHARWSRTLRPG